MSTIYSIVTRQVATRINAITSPVAATIQSTYTTAPFTSSQVGSTIFPFSAMKDAILNIEGRLVEAIASTGNHPYRMYFSSVTDALSNGDELPGLDENDVPMLGQWGAVYDVDDPTKLYRPKDVAQVIRRTSNAGNKYKIPVYWYAIDDLIYHTGDSVKIRCCVYDRFTQSVAFDADGNMLLPDALVDALVCGAVAELMRDDEFVAQAQVYRNYYEATEQALRNGLKSAQGKAETGPLISVPNY